MTLWTAPGSGSTLGEVLAAIDHLGYAGELVDDLPFDRIMALGRRRGFHRRTNLRIDLTKLNGADDTDKGRIVSDNVVLK